jgi:hypothetical protein
MARSSLHRAAVRSSLKERANPPDKPGRYQCHELVAAAGGAALLVVIAVLSAWAHYSLSTVRPASPNTAATPPASAFAPPLNSPPMRVQLRAWLTKAEPSINALVIARDNIAAAAAQDDIAATGAACQTAAGVVANSQQQMPSPDPALNSALQQAINSYQVGIRYCISGTQNQDAKDIEQAATYINQGNTDLQAAVDILERDLSPGPRDVVWTV